MSRIYSNSYFHYTNEIEYLIGILRDGFYGYYCQEEFKIDKLVKYFYIPVVSFCDIPLSQVSYITYGDWGIGMSSVWGNANDLTPICYYPNKTDSPLTKQISSIARDVYKKVLKSNNVVRNFNPIIAYSKPRNKYIPNGHRRNNYIERECRKAYLECSLDANFHKRKHSKMHLLFTPKEVSFIVVPNELGRKNLIDNILQFNTIGGKAIAQDSDRLLLISKIITLEELRRDY